MLCTGDKAWSWLTDMEFIAARMAFYLVDCASFVRLPLSSRSIYGFGLRICSCFPHAVHLEVNYRYDDGVSISSTQRQLADDVFPKGFVIQFESHIVTDAAEDPLSKTYLDPAAHVKHNF